jgi:hypothetical protein
VDDVPAVVAALAADDAALEAALAAGSAAGAGAGAGAGAAAGAGAGAGAGSSFLPQAANAAAAIRVANKSDFFISNFLLSGTEREKTFFENAMPPDGCVDRAAKGRCSRCSARNYRPITPAPATAGNSVLTAQACSKGTKANFSPATRSGPRATPGGARVRFRKCRCSARDPGAA